MRALLFGKFGNYRKENTKAGKGKKKVKKPILNLKEFFENDSKARAKEIAQFDQEKEQYQFKYKGFTGIISHSSLPELEILNFHGIDFVIKRAGLKFGFLIYCRPEFVAKNPDILPTIQKQLNAKESANKKWVVVGDGEILTAPSSGKTIDNEEIFSIISENLEIDSEVCETFRNNNQKYLQGK